MPRMHRRASAEQCTSNDGALIRERSVFKQLTDFWSRTDLRCLVSYRYAPSKLLTSRTIAVLVAKPHALCPIDGQLPRVGVQLTLHPGLSLFTAHRSSQVVQAATARRQGDGVTAA